MEASSSKVGDSTFRQIKRGLGIKSPFSFLTRLFFVHEVGVLLLKERPCGIKW